VCIVAKTIRERKGGLKAMKIICRVEFDMLNHSEVVGYNLPDSVIERLAPINATDDAFMTLTGEVLQDSVQHVEKLTIRKDAVDVIAKEMAIHLVKALKSRDTLNGYPLVMENI